MLRLYLVVLTAGVSRCTSPELRYRYLSAEAGTTRRRSPQKLHGSCCGVAKSYSKKGHFVQDGNHQAFVIEEGNDEAPALLCIHGVPASSFLYRKVLPELASRGYRGIAIDIIGLGLSDKAPDYDYTFTALELSSFHLVVHDMGGPAGIEMASRKSDLVSSVTVLNTFLINLEGFEKPLVMRIFERTLLGRLLLLAPVLSLMLWSFTRRTAGDRHEVGLGDFRAQVELLRYNDNGWAFFQMMKGFETTSEKEELYLATLQGLVDDGKPIQFVWGNRATTVSTLIHMEYHFKRLWDSQTRR